MLHKHLITTEKGAQRHRPDNFLTKRDKDAIHEHHLHLDDRRDFSSGGSTNSRLATSVPQDGTKTVER
jgi:hypothetical protein